MENNDAPIVDESLPTEVEQEESETVEEAVEPSESSSEKKEPKGVQKRLDELTKNWRETERDRDHWRELAMKYVNQPEPQREIQQQIPQPQPQVKTLADFEYDENQYQSYLFNQAQEVARRTVQEQYERESMARRATSFQAKESDFSKSNEDYMQVTRNPNLSITRDMVSLLQESDSGPDVLYYLGKNPEVANSLANLPPVILARELGRIEEKIAYTKKSAATVSNAPPPTPKIDGGSPSINVSASSPDSDKLSADEWLKRRNKQLKR